MAVDVFLSHRGVTKDFIVNLATFLEQDEENPLACWYAPRNIEKGRDYATEIDKGIQEAKIFLVFLNEQFEDPNTDEEENYVNNEVISARTRKKMILTVFQNRTEFPKSLNIHLNNRQTFSMDDFPDKETAMAELKNILLNLREQTIFQNKFVDKAKAISEQQNSTLPGFLKISDQMLKNYQEQFIHTEYFEEILRNQHAVVIYGLPESGKTFHAVNLLLEEKKSAIYESTSMDVISTLMKTKIPQNAGFIIRSNKAEMDMMTEAKKDNLLSSLKNANSTLILCSNEPIRGFPSREVKFPKRRYELLLQKLKTALQSEYDPEEQYFTVFKQNVPEESLNSIAIINDYVTQIKSAIDKVIPIEDFIHNVQFLKNDRLKESLDKLHVTELFYPLAVSLNPDRSYKQIYSTYMELCELYKETYLDKPIQSMEWSKQEVIKRFELKTFEGIGNDHLESFIEEKINFLIPHLDKKIWTFAWNNYHILHNVLSTYLLQLVDSKRKYHVNKAIEIIEDILQDNLHDNIEYFLSPLAMSKREKNHIIASEIVSKLAENPKYSSSMFRLVKNWLKSQNLNKVNTALLSILSSIGIENLSESIALLLEKLFKCPELSFEILRALALLSTLVHYFETIDFQFFETIRDWLKDFYLDDELNEAGLYELALTYFHHLFALEPSIYFDSHYLEKEKLLVSIQCENMRVNNVEFTADLVQQFLEYCKHNPEHKQVGRTFYLSLKERCFNQGLSFEFNQLESLLNT